MKKKNNKIIIILMALIIVILAVLCVLFATGTISFNNTIDDITKESNVSDEEDNTSSVLTNEEAKTIVRDLFTNETVRQIIDNPQITYCTSSDNKIYTENDLGLSYQWNGLKKCREYNSYEELTNYFKTLFTNDYYTNNLENKLTITTQYTTMADGTVMYNYYEKDGSLYYALTGKGSNISKDSMSNVVYSVNSVEENNINASINVTWLDVNNVVSTTENIDIEIVKDNNIWKINKYIAK